MRNIDPFEKKKRLAQMQTTSDFSSRKLSSRREENEMKRERPPIEGIGNASPT